MPRPPLADADTTETQHDAAGARQGGSFTPRRSGWLAGRAAVGSGYPRARRPAFTKPALLPVDLTQPAGIRPKFVEQFEQQGIHLPNGIFGFPF